jgi:hypothetical protein
VQHVSVSEGSRDLLCPLLRVQLLDSLCCCNKEQGESKQEQVKQQAGECARYNGSAAAYKTDQAQARQQHKR